MDGGTLFARILKLQFAASLVIPSEAISLAPIWSESSLDRPLRVLIPASNDPLLKSHASDPLLKPAEAAEYIGVTENTLSVWRCVGRYDIPYIKVGRLVRYRKSALDAFLQRRTQGS
jgi:excisionase family DNA binding protein